jgi:hypothetical protein
MIIDNDAVTESKPSFGDILKIVKKEEIDYYLLFHDNEHCYAIDLRTGYAPYCAKGNIDITDFIEGIESNNNENNISIISSNKAHIYFE